MKNFQETFNYLTVWFTITGCLCGSYAQVVLDRNDYPVNHGEEINLYTWSDVTPVTVDIGLSGGNQTWLFDTAHYPNGRNVTNLVIDPLDSPHKVNFPGADFVWKFNGVAYSTYSYFEVSDTAMFYLGFASGPADSAELYIESPPDKQLIFPLHYLTSWDNLRKDTLELDNTVNLVYTTYQQFDVDAWGTITVPLGTYDCLRIVEDREKVTDFYVDNVLVDSDTTMTLNYTWIAENEGIIATVLYYDGTNHSFPTARIVSMRLPSVTGIEDDSPLLTDGFALHQNYPNPFNPSTTIAFYLPRSAKIHLEVFDIAGRKVATLVDGVLGTGSHQVDFQPPNLSSGTFFYRLKGEGINRVKRMTFIK